MTWSEEQVVSAPTLCNHDVLARRTKMLFMTDNTFLLRTRPP